ncbi:MAG TPA: LptF/LptG family permease [Myxococcota bacterium]|nr:LptF/LptG family permease [Myxococcota bacterium]
MRILSRRFLASYLGFYAGILVASILVIAIIEMMVNMERALEFQRGAQGVVTYLLLRLPSYYLPYLVPVTSFAAAFLAVGLAARAQEILAAKAGGIRPQRIALPLLCAAALLSAAALLVFETVVRESGSAFAAARQGDPNARLFSSKGTFWYHHGRFLYNVRDADRATRTLHDVRVYERDDAGRLRRSIFASRARIDAQEQWELLDATVRSFDGTDMAAAPRVERLARTVLPVASQSDLALLDADAGTLPLPELRAYVEAMERSGRESTRYRALLHARMTEPITVLLFAGLAIPVGLAVERSRSLAVAALQGVALVALYYALQGTAQVLAAGGVAAAVPAPWVLLGVFSAFAVWRLFRVPA